MEPEPTVSVQPVQNLTTTPMTNGSGHYSFTLLAPGIVGDYVIRVNATYSGQEGNNSVVLSVVENSLPSTPGLNYPADNDTAFVNRTPRFNWSAASDSDSSDIITYHLEVSTAEAFSSTLLNQSGFNNTYLDYPSALAFNTYWWRVQAYDGENYTAFSAIFNFSLVESVSIDWIVNSTNFGALLPGEHNSTDDNDPAPLSIENTGNVEVNLSINSTALWSMVALNTSYYQAKANSTSESGSFSTSGSVMTWFNLSTEMKDFVSRLNWTDATDSVAIDINITSPGDEPPGAKRADIVVRGVDN